VKIRALLVAVALLPSTAMAQQAFTCPYGDRGACLGFGETVCTSSGRCVRDDALCFDRYQCNYEGFTCRSNVTECIDDYDNLLRRFNTLVDDYNGLLADSREIQDAWEAAADELDETTSQLATTLADLLRAEQSLRETQAEVAELEDELEDTQSDLRRSQNDLTRIRGCIENLGRFESPSSCL